MAEEVPNKQPISPDKQDFRDKPQKNNPQAGDKGKTDGGCGC
jgi:hypothetical protein